MWLSLTVLPRLAILLFITVCASVLGDHYFRPTKVETECCKSVSRSRIPYAITAMKLQGALHPCVRAVIFYTDKTGPICSDPKARWIREKVKELKNKGNKKQKQSKKQRRKPKKATHSLQTKP